MTPPPAGTARAGGRAGRIPFRAGRRIGVALGSDGMTAVVGAGDHTRELFLPLPVRTDSGDMQATLALGFEELLDRLRGGGEEGSPWSLSGDVRVAIALLPPLCETKLLRLPPLEADETEEVVRRTVAQHFLTGAVPSVVAVGIEHDGPSAGSVETVGSRAGRPLLASAASRALAEALYHAVTALGWSVDAIVPAHAAWLAAVRGGSEAKSAAPGAPRLLVGPHAGTAHVLRVEGDVPTGCRRVAASVPSEVVAAAGAGPGRVWVLGEGKERQAILDAFLTAGWHPGPPAQLPGTPAQLAAAWAARTEMEFVPPRLALERRDRVRRAGVAMGIGAAVLLVAAAGLQLWGAGRELAAVRERRAEIREAVAPVLAASDEITTIAERLEAIEVVQRATGSWTFALVELSVVLPESVHLVALQAAGDTLVIDAVGQRAGDALDALRRASSLRDVRQEGSVQYEVEGGAVARERFTLSAIRVPEAASLVSIPAPGGVQ